MYQMFYIISFNPFEKPMNKLFSFLYGTPIPVNSVSWDDDDDNNVNGDRVGVVLANSVAPTMCQALF